MSSENIIVRVQNNNRIQFLDLGAEVDWQKFNDKGNLFICCTFDCKIFIVDLSPAFALFGLTPHPKNVVHLTDNLGTEIPKNLFEHIIRSFHSGSSFFVQLSYELSAAQQQLELVTPCVSNQCGFSELIHQLFTEEIVIFQHLEAYFRRCNKSEILIKEKAFANIGNDTTMPAIDTQTRYELIRIIVDFMIESFGLNLTNFQKVNTAKVAVILFPRLKFHRGDGTVSRHNLNMPLTFGYGL